MVLVSYDVARDDHGARRLRKVAKTCQNYGQRVQYSVFECLVAPDQFVRLKHELLEIMADEYDSIRFYLLGANWKNRVEQYGVKKALDPEGTMII